MNSLCKLAVRLCLVCIYEKEVMWVCLFILNNYRFPVECRVLVKVSWWVCATSMSLRSKSLWSVPYLLLFLPIAVRCHCWPCIYRMSFFHIAFETLSSSVIYTWRSENILGRWWHCEAMKRCKWRSACHIRCTVDDCSDHTPVYKEAQTIFASGILPIAPEFMAFISCCPPSTWHLTPASCTMFWRSCYKLMGEFWCSLRRFHVRVSVSSLSLIAVFAAVGFGTGSITAGSLE